MRRGHRLRRMLGRAALGLGLAYVSCVAMAWGRVAAAAEGASFVPMAPWGAGYRSYSMVGAALGRQYVRRRVRDALASAFETLDDGWVVAETGWRGGGAFWPHRTHRDGRAVDLLVPMRSAGGVPVRLGSWPWQGYGYAHELDADGHLGSLRFDAARALLPPAPLGSPRRPPAPRLSLMRVRARHEWPREMHRRRGVRVPSHRRPRPARAAELAPAREPRGLRLAHAEARLRRGHQRSL